MNMYQAEQEGLQFQGGTANEYRKDEIEKLKQRAKEIRKLGFKARAIKSGVNEWGGGCYVLMVEPNYMEYQEAVRGVSRIQGANARIASVKEQAEKEINQIVTETERLKALCDKYGVNYQ